MVAIKSTTIEPSGELRRKLRRQSSRALLPLLRCSRDGGELSLDAESVSDDTGVVDGQLRCGVCESVYRIENGIARLMVDTASAEDQREIAIRDHEEFYTSPGPFVPPPDGWRSELMDRLEIPSHLAALQPLAGKTVLEFGCGDGRFTMLLAAMEVRVLAVDFRSAACGRCRAGCRPEYHPRPIAPAGGFMARISAAGSGWCRRISTIFTFVRELLTCALSATPLDSAR